MAAPAVYNMAPGRAEQGGRWCPELRHSRWDAVLVAFAVLQGIVVCRWPSIPMIAIGLWWNSNTISHYFIHLPFFRRRFWNRCFAAYQTVLLGIPQRLWRDRHLAHHADARWGHRWSGELVGEVGLVAGLWSVLLAVDPIFFVSIYLPGCVLGLCLCSLQGHFEHARGTTSHYGRLYNSLFFNDGYHIEHHAHPSAHWRSLPQHREAEHWASRWPPVLRWMESVNLEALERLVLRSKVLQRFVVSRHAAAFASLIEQNERAEFRSIGIVGGGLFPRTALVLQSVLPGCALTVIEENPAHIAIARGCLDDQVEYLLAHYDGTFARRFDAVVIPLAFRGELEEVCAGQRGATFFVHDWIWRRGPRSEIISWVLLKRLNRIET
jgi:hypothetical protein